jgi:hypothetical protein
MSETFSTNSTIDSALFKKQSLGFKGKEKPETKIFKLIKDLKKEFKVPLKPQIIKEPELTFNNFEMQKCKTCGLQPRNPTYTYCSSSCAEADGTTLKTKKLVKCGFCFKETKEHGVHMCHNKRKHIVLALEEPKLIDFVFNHKKKEIEDFKDSLRFMYKKNFVGGSLTSKRVRNLLPTDLDYESFKAEMKDFKSLKRIDLKRCGCESSRKETSARNHAPHCSLNKKTCPACDESFSFNSGSRKFYRHVCGIRSADDLLFYEHTMLNPSKFRDSFASILSQIKIFKATGTEPAELQEFRLKNKPRRRRARVLRFSRPLFERCRRCFGEFVKRNMWKHFYSCMRPSVRSPLLEATDTEPIRRQPYKQLLRKRKQYIDACESFGLPRSERIFHSAWPFKCWDVALSALTSDPKAQDFLFSFRVLEQDIADAESHVLDVNAINKLRRWIDPRPRRLGASNPIYEMLTRELVEIETSLQDMIYGRFTEPLLAFKEMNKCTSRFQWEFPSLEGSDFELLYHDAEPEFRIVLAAVERVYNEIRKEFYLYWRATSADDVDLLCEEFANLGSA